MAPYGKGVSTQVPVKCLLVYGQELTAPDREQEGLRLFFWFNAAVLVLYRLTIIAIQAFSTV